VAGNDRLELKYRLLVTLPVDFQTLDRVRKLVSERADVLANVGDCVKYSDLLSGSDLCKREETVSLPVTDIREVWESDRVVENELV
jgi:hypothetical protein